MSRSLDDAIGETKALIKIDGPMYSDESEVIETLLKNDIAMMESLKRLEERPH